MKSIINDKIMGINYFLIDRDERFKSKENMNETSILECKWN